VWKTVNVGCEEGGGFPSDQSSCRFSAPRRPAAWLIGVAPLTIRRPDLADNADIRTQMRSIAERRRRFCYHRMVLFLDCARPVEDAVDQAAMACISAARRVMQIDGCPS